MTGFRSIKGTESFLVDDKVTILIGANDHGKSNIISAVEYLNDEKTFQAEDINWDLADTTKNIDIEWHFDASEDALIKLGKLAPVSKTATMIVQVAPVTQVEGQPVAIVTPAVVAPEPAPTQEPTFEVNTDNEIVFYKDNKGNTLGVKSLPLPIPKAKIAEVISLRPRVELFEPPTTNFKDQVSLLELEKPEFEFMQGIFRLAGIWNDRAIVFAQNNRTSRMLDEASTRLTNILNDKWNQGRDLNWRLKHTGTNGDQIVIEIEDPSIGSTYTRPSLKSSGFKTYFLLTMIIYARTENQNADSYIYLFDEPGTYLHPHAQLDLQRSFETISEKSQLIYTTHSLFLINKNHPGRNRVISKTKDGTKIDQKPFIKNWKSVRESLGILLSNNFLIAEKTLLVEGPSDVIYLLHAIKKLKNDNKVDIDLNDLSIVDAGSSENYIAMAKLMLCEGRELVALLDGDKGGETIADHLSKVCEKEIKSGTLKIHKLPKDKSSEDIFTNTIILKDAVKTVVSNLVSDGFRELKDGLNLDTEIRKIESKTGVTLGATLDKITPKFFKEEVKVSKLSIALQYEDIATLATDIPDTAVTEIEKIKLALTLKGETNKETGVFDEIKV